MPALPSVNFVHRRGKCATPTGQTVAELMIGMYLVSVAVAMMRGSSSVRARVQRYRFSILGRGRATRFERQFCDAGFVEFAEADTVGETGGVDIHPHVDERFDFRGLACRPHESQRRAHLVEDELHGVE